MEDFLDHPIVEVGKEVVWMAKSEVAQLIRQNGEMGPGVPCFPGGINEIAIVSKDQVMDHARDVWHHQKVAWVPFVPCHQRGDLLQLGFQKGPHLAFLFSGFSWRWLL